MNRTIIAIGTAAVLTAGMTGAAFAADRYASPSQPVPYSQLNAYMKGSASKRAAILAQNTDAMPAASAGVNSSATTPSTSTDTAAPPVNSTSSTPATMPNDSATAPGAAKGPAPMTGATNPPATPAVPGTAPAPQ